MAPVRNLSALKQLFQHYRDSVQITSFDTNNNPNVPEKYCVHAVPTWLFFITGYVVAQCSGAGPSNGEMQIMMIDKALEAEKLSGPV